MRTRLAVLLPVLVLSLSIAAAPNQERRSGVHDDGPEPVLVRVIHTVQRWLHTIVLDDLTIPKP